MERVVRIEPLETKVSGAELVEYALAKGAHIGHRSVVFSKGGEDIAGAF